MPGEQCVAMGLETWRLLWSVHTCRVTMCQVNRTYNWVTIIIYVTQINASFFGQLSQITYISYYSIIIVYIFGTIITNYLFYPPIILFSLSL